jgi:hypothetical protein
VRADAEEYVRARTVKMARVDTSLANRPVCHGARLTDCSTHGGLSPIYRKDLILKNQTHSRLGLGIALACIQFVQIGARRIVGQRKKRETTSRGFEPLRAEPSSFRDYRLNHSANLSGVEPGKDRTHGLLIGTIKRQNADLRYANQRGLLIRSQAHFHCATGSVLETIFHFWGLGLGHA